MSAALVPVSTNCSAGLPAIGTPTVIEAWLRARNQNTLRGYLSDLERFREWLRAPSTAAAVETLLSTGQANANLMVMNYQAALVERGLAGAVSFPCSLPCLQGNPNVRFHGNGALDRVRQFRF